MSRHQEAIQNFGVFSPKREREKKQTWLGAKKNVEIKCMNSFQWN